MADVFVSYKAEDRRRVKPLVEALKAEGFSVWWDEQIGGGDAWREAIERELDAAKSVVVVWSKRSIGPDGRFVRDEASRAMERDVYLPVRIDNVRLPLGFGETQALPLTGWHGHPDDQRFQAVLLAVRKSLGEGAGSDRRTVHGASVDRRAVLLGGAVAGVTAVGVGAWALLRSGAAEASARSIAVLPFANLSGDPSQAYFSDGLAEELRNALSRIPEINVMARTSSEKVRDDDIQTAARKLGVDSILTGSVRRSPSTIRISTQLVDGRKGLERWSETYDRPIGDTLIIQADIAERVAAALSLRLGGGARSLLEAGGTTTPAAQDLLLQVYRDKEFNEQSLERKIGLLDAALALDPNYAQALAQKASLLMVRAGTYSANATAAYAGHVAALKVANQALAIAPRMSLGYAVRGDILRQMLNMREALADAERASALPGKNNAELLGFRALILTQLGHEAEAVQIGQQWIEVDPLNPLAHANQGVNLFFARRYPAAVATLQRSLEIAPNNDRARAYFGHALLQQGKLDAAESEYRKLSPENYRRLTGLGIVAARRGNKQEALSQVQLMRRVDGDADLYQYAQIYAQLGMPNEALNSLEAAVKVHDSGASGLRVDPFLDPIRRQARFAAIEKNIDFP